MRSRFSVALIAVLLLLCLIFTAASTSAAEDKSPLKKELARLLKLKQQLKTKWNPNQYLNGRILRIAKRFRIVIPRRCKRRVIVDDEVITTIKKLAECDKETTPELPPTNPTNPTNPTTPTTPSNPSNPTTPTKPAEPSNPSNPSTPSEPSTPSKPTCPALKCKRSCGARGYKKNKRGCNTCRCNPKPSEPSNPSNPSTPTTGCPAVTCPKNCPEGSSIKVDQKTGCMVCSCKGTTTPTTPTNPTTPSEPSTPTTPNNPTTPSEPNTPTTPTCPVRRTCRMLCKNGYYVDSNGCVDTCRCKSTRCPQYRCLRACPYGYKKNENGCTTCSCKPKPRCPKYGCRKHCPNGYVVNANGCVNTCQCKQSPGTSCPLRKCRGNCPHGYKTDRKGCQTCACIRKPVRPRPPVIVRPRPVRPRPRPRPPVRPPVVDRPPVIVRPRPERPVRPRPRPRPPVIDRPPVIVRPPVVRPPVRPARPGRIRRIIRRIRRGRGRGDPHYVLLDSGKDVLFNGLGDFILAESQDKEFIAHVRIGKWHKKATVNIGAAVKLGSDIIEFRSKNNQFYLNKEEAEFKIGKKYELEGGYLIRKTEHQFIIKSIDGVELFGERFALHDGNSYMDIQVDAPNDVEFKRGLIINGKGIQGKNLFRSVKTVKKIKQRVVEIPKWAKNACAKKGLTGKQLKDCAYDAAVSGKEFANEIAKDEAKFTKKADKVLVKVAEKKN